MKNTVLLGLLLASVAAAAPAPMHPMRSMHGAMPMTMLPGARLLRTSRTAHSTTWTYQGHHAREALSFYAAGLTRAGWRADTHMKMGMVARGVYQEAFMRRMNTLQLSACNLGATTVVTLRARM